MFVSHIAELSDAHLYFTKFRKFLGALPPLEKSLATPLLPCMVICKIFFEEKALPFGNYILERSHMP